MRVFVAGATGYTGREVVAQLRCADHDVVAHVRQDSARLSHWLGHFTRLGATVDTTAWQADAIAETLRKLQPDVVFALLGTTAKRRRRANHNARDGAAETYEAVDYGLTVLLLSAAERCGRGPRFVYLSSLGARERAPGAYLRARWRVEAALQASSLPWTIARPSFITGDNRDEPRLGERIGAGLVDAILTALAAIGVRGPHARFASLRNDALARGLVHHGLAPESVGQIVEADRLREVAAL